MGVATVEATIENGQVKLPEYVHLPEHTKVYVVIPDPTVPVSVPRIASPKLVRSEQAADFTKQMTQETW